MLPIGIETWFSGRVFHDTAIGAYQHPKCRLQFPLHRHANEERCTCVARAADGCSVALCGHLVGTGPAGATAAPLGAARGRHRHREAPSVHHRRRRSFSTAAEAARRSLAAPGAVAAATPAALGVRTVEPRPPARSATAVEVPAATKWATQGVSRAREGADEARIRALAAVAHLLSACGGTRRHRPVGGGVGQPPGRRKDLSGCSHGS